MLAVSTIREQKDVFMPTFYYELKHDAVGTKHSKRVCVNTSIRIHIYTCAFFWCMYISFQMQLESWLLWEFDGFLVQCGCLSFCCNCSCCDEFPLGSHFQAHVPVNQGQHWAREAEHRWYVIVSLFLLASDCGTSQFNLWLNHCPEIIQKILAYFCLDFREMVL